MFFEYIDALVNIQVPYTHGFIARTGGSSPSVGRYRYSVYRASVPFECGDALASIQVPYTHRAIARAGNSSLPVRSYC